MAFAEEQQTFVTVLPDGQLQVRVESTILKDGVEVARTNHRRVVVPGDDIATESDEQVRTAMSAFHTPEVIAAYQATKK